MDFLSKFKKLPRVIHFFIALGAICLGGAGYTLARSYIVKPSPAVVEESPSSEKSEDIAEEKSPSEESKESKDKGSSESKDGKSEEEKPKEDKKAETPAKKDDKAAETKKPDTTPSTPAKPSTPSTPSAPSTTPTQPSTPTTKSDPISAVAPRPYYYMLTADEKVVYNQYVSNANELNDSFVPDTILKGSEVERVIEAVLGDHPELFWLESMVNYEMSASTNNVVKVYVPYNDLAYNLDSARAAFNSKVNTIIANASKLATHLEREKYVHDTLIGSNTYDLNSANNQSAYSALVSGRTVCAGYSRAFQYIMNRLGVTTYFVSGRTSGQEHAWNVVYINGRYYNVDLTWDAAKKTSGYFNASDGLMPTHQRTGLSTGLPRCP